MANASTAAGVGPILVHAPPFCWAVRSNGETSIAKIVDFISFLLLFKYEAALGAATP